MQDVWLIGQPHQRDGSAWLPDGPPSPAASESRHSTAAATNSAAPGDNPAQWLTVRSFTTAQQCTAALKAERYALWCTDLSQSAEVLPAVLRGVSAAGVRTRDSSSLAPDTLAHGEDEAPAWRLAVAFSGSEVEGLSQEMLNAADKLVYLPRPVGGTLNPAYFTHQAVCAIASMAMVRRCSRQMRPTKESCFLIPTH